jgi:hypothetical protein
MSKEIKDIDAALEASGMRLGHDTAGYARSLIEKVDRPVTKIQANCFGLTVAWRDGVEVFVNPSGSYQVVGTELWMDEDDVAKRVRERLDRKKPAYESLCRQINDACAQISQDMRKKGVALLRELGEKRPVESVSVDRQGLVLTLYDDAKRRIDVKVGILDQFSVALDGNAVPTTCFGVTSAVQVVDLLLKEKSQPPEINDFERSHYDATPQELGSLMKTLVSEIGLRPDHGASSKQVDCGWMLSFGCQAGRVEMLVYYDRHVWVKINGQRALDAPDVSMAVIYLKELLAEEKKETALARPRPPSDPVTDLALEIECHLDNNTGHLISKLGLQPSDYSAEISTSGLTISIHGQVKATVRCDGTVQVERHGQLVCQAPNVEVASTVVKELITDDSPSKRKIVEVQQEPVQAKKSPKLAIIEQEEEEPAVPTPLLNLE